MTGRNPEVGWENGRGRAMGPGDQPKVQQAGIQQSYHVDIETQRMQRQIIAQGKRTHSAAPAMGDFRLREGEPAVKLRHKGDEVFTCISLLDEQFMEHYPEDPEMARLCIRSIIQFVGIVDQDARDDMFAPKVTLKIGGTVPQIAPGEYNVAGQENAVIQTGNKVVYDVPDLISPIIAGAGRPPGKLLMVPRAADKTSVSSRLMRTIAHIIHDPNKYKTAMQRHEHVCNSSMNAAVAIKNMALIHGLMFLDLLVSAGVVTIAAPELNTNNASQEEKIARIAEGLSMMYPGEHNLLQPGKFAASLTQAQRRTWNELALKTNQRLFPLPNPDNGKLNAASEFGFSINPNGQVPTSKGRSLETGELLRTPVGTLLGKSLTAFQYALESIVVMADDETRNVAGWAASTPNQLGTGEFTLVLAPQGGIAYKSS